MRLEISVVISSSLHLKMGQLLEFREAFHNACNISVFGRIFFRVFSKMAGENVMEKCLNILCGISLTKKPRREKVYSGNKLFCRNCHRDRTANRSLSLENLSLTRSSAEVI